MPNLKEIAQKRLIEMKLKNSETLDKIFFTIKSRANAELKKGNDVSFSDLTPEGDWETEEKFGVSIAMNVYDKESNLIYQTVFPGYSFEEFFELIKHYKQYTFKDISNDLAKNNFVTLKIMGLID